MKILAIPISVMSHIEFLSEQSTYKSLFVNFVPKTFSQSYSYLLLPLYFPSQIFSSKSPYTFCFWACQWYWCWFPVWATLSNAGYNFSWRTYNTTIVSSVFSLSLSVHILNTFWYNSSSISAYLPDVYAICSIS